MCIAKAMYLEKSKCRIIWNRRSTILDSGFFYSIGAGWQGKRSRMARKEEIPHVEKLAAATSEAHTDKLVMV